MSRSKMAFTPGVREFLDEGGLAARRMKASRWQLWFPLGVLLCTVLLAFAWQQNRGLRLASEVAHLEAREEALEAHLRELGARVSRLHQPDFLMARLPRSSSGPDLGSRVTITAAPLPEGEVSTGSERVWLAGLGIEVPEALAAAGQ